MLYDTVAEPLNDFIKRQQNIKGIKIYDVFVALLFQHADDTTITVKDTVENMSHYQHIRHATDAKVVAILNGRCHKYYLDNNTREEINKIV